jgi:hypothetical protein
MQGNPQTILEAPTSMVLAMAEYVSFLGEYHAAAVEINKDQT